jgi:hypothetical protein
MELLENWNVWPDKTAEVAAAAPRVRNLDQCFLEKL